MSLLKMAAAITVLQPKMRDAIGDAERLGDALANLPDDPLAGISDSLRRLLGAGEAVGDPYSAKFDKETGKMLGGAFADKYAFQLIEAIAELVRRKGEKGQDPVRYQQNLQQAKDYFRYIFGNKFGDIGRLIEEFNALLKRQEAAQRGNVSTGTVSRTSSSSTTTASLRILQQAGMFR